MQEFGATHIAALNRTSTDVAKLYGVRGTPTNVVIDRNGNTVEKLIGFNADRLNRALSRAGI